MQASWSRLVRAAQLALLVAVPLPASAALLPGDILYSEMGFVGGVVGIHPDGTPSGFSVATPDVRDLATGPDGTIYIATGGTGAGNPDRIMRIDPVTGALTTVFTSPTPERVTQMVGLAVEPSGNLILSAYYGVLRIDPRTGASTTLVPPSDGDPHLRHDVEVGPDGSIYVGRESGLPALYRIDPVTAEVRPVPSAGKLTSLQFFSVAPNGMIYAPNYPPGQGAPFTDRWQLIRANPATGEETVLWGTPSDYFLTDVAADARFVYGVEEHFPEYPGPADGAVVRFDPVSRTRTVILSGPNVFNPYRIAVFVPEPTAALGLVVGAGACLLLRRRLV